MLPDDLLKELWRRSGGNGFYAVYVQWYITIDNPANIQQGLTAGFFATR